LLLRENNSTDFQKKIDGKVAHEPLNKPSIYDGNNNPNHITLGFG